MYLLIPPTQAQTPGVPSPGAPSPAFTVGCTVNECCPPSTAGKVGIAAGDLAIFLVCCFLFMRLMELRFIQENRNPLLGRHLGVSLALGIAGVGMAGLYLGVTGCYDAGVWLWAGFVFAIFLLHAVYTLIVVRSAA